MWIDDPEYLLKVDEEVKKQLQVQVGTILFYSPFVSHCATCLSSHCDIPLKHSKTTGTSFSMTSGTTLNIDTKNANDAQFPGYPPLNSTCAQCVSFYRQPLI